MRPNSLRVAVPAAIILALTLMVPAVADAQRGITYQVTITNITQNQVLSPPVVASHRNRTGIFEAGESATMELRVLAEDGDPGPLAALLEADPDVLSVAVSPGPVMPGESVTLEIQARGSHRRLSAVGMLVTTNDAFFGVDGVVLVGRSRLMETSAPAYDAGTEANNENCDFIPGPPCDNPGVPDPDGAEGFIAIHPGIHGVGDLEAAAWDWRNPVAKITVSRGGH